MATAALPRGNPQRFAVNGQVDNYFFPGIAILILVTVFVGFARSYFLAGVLRAPLPNLLIHIHGAVFSSWILLLITQTLLVSAGRVDIHRWLGLVGFGLACLMVILGVLAASNSLARGFAPRLGLRSQDLLRHPHRRHVHVDVCHPDLFRLPRPL